MGCQEGGGLNQVHPVQERWFVGHIGAALQVGAGDAAVDGIDPLNRFHGESLAAIGGRRHKKSGAAESVFEFVAELGMVPDGGEGSGMQGLHDE